MYFNSHYYGMEGNFGRGMICKGALALLTVCQIFILPTVIFCFIRQISPGVPCLAYAIFKTTYAAITVATHSLILNMVVLVLCLDSKVQGYHVCTT